MVKLICTKVFIFHADERFRKDRNRPYISKWLRNSIRLYSCFEESLDSLKSCFRDVDDHIGIDASSSDDLDAECENVKAIDTRKKNNNGDKDGSVCREYIGLERDSEKKLREFFCLSQLDLYSLLNRSNDSCLLQFLNCFNGSC
ncbi:hypothetical protein Sango_2068100 [Sesamum angolense]|uniref:Uncharacterized protein n=1 Tax=Sesamum angolense TaxID=2727404 RepID=A0AAE2BLR6_9LAMI|nr:hypothetical protein Sango_2068100 [Sesamum angolense]